MPIVERRQPRVVISRGVRGVAPRRLR
jgi:hypothetical protein